MTTKFLDESKIFVLNGLDYQTNQCKNGAKVCANEIFVQSYLYSVF